MRRVFPDERPGFQFQSIADFTVTNKRIPVMAISINENQNNESH